MASAAEISTSYKLDELNSERKKSLVDTSVVTVYRASIDKSEHDCHLLPPGINCMTHRHWLQDFPDTSELSHHKSNRIS
jgi:hypothetical protein